MFSRRFGSRVLVVLLASLFIAQGTLIVLPARVTLAAESPPEVNAENYLIADSKTGRILASKNEDLPHIPASLTKIMTLYILFDEISAGTISLDDMVSVSEKAWATGVPMFILVGTEVRWKT